jgi:hypothetical protein
MDGKITYVHGRLWPALVKLASRFRKADLAKTWNEHTHTGAHRSRRVAFPHWVPPDVLKAAEQLTLAEAEQVMGPWLAFAPTNTTARTRSQKAKRRRR